MINKTDRLLNYLTENKITYDEFIRFMKNYIPEETEEDLYDFIYELLNDNNDNINSFIESN
jgi:hypothetical protein